MFVQGTEYAFIVYNKKWFCAMNPLNLIFILCIKTISLLLLYVYYF